MRQEIFAHLDIQATFLYNRLMQSQPEEDSIDFLVRMFFLDVQVLADCTIIEE